MITLGLDIGGSSIKGALLGGPAGTVTARSPRYARPDGLQLRDALAALVRSLAAGGGPAAPARIGLCVPGIVDPQTLSVTVSVNVPGLVGTSLPELVSVALAAAGGPRGGGGEERLTVVSDAQAAAHDFWVSQGGAAGRLLGISMGTGVGACVLDGGQPLRITGQSSGHVGQIDVTLAEDAQTPPVGPDGGAGSLEAYVGLPALLARYGGEAESLFARIGANDPPIRALIRAIRIAHAIYRPDQVVLLGGVGMRLAPLAGAIREGVARNLTSLARPGWTLSCGNSDFHAALGSARLATMG